MRKRSVRPVALSPAALLAARDDRLDERSDAILIRVVEADLENPAHQRAIVDLVDAYAAEEIGQGSALSATARDAMIDGLRRHDSLTVLALVGEQAVGVAVCFVGFSTFYGKPLVNIHDLIVMSDFRGQGIGRQLLEAVETRARDLGCCKVTLEVREDNRALALYESLGFGNGPAGGGRQLFLQKIL